jgi:hypothetical protein
MAYNAATQRSMTITVRGAPESRRPHANCPVIGSEVSTFYPGGNVRCRLYDIVV